MDAAWDLAHVLTLSMPCRAAHPFCKLTNDSGGAHCRLGFAHLTGAASGCSGAVDDAMFAFARLPVS